MLCLLLRNSAAVHQLLYIGVVVGQLRQFTISVQIGAGIARVAQIGIAAAHQSADSGGAHTGQRLLPQCLLEHIAVGAEQCLL